MIVKVEYDVYYEKLCCSILLSLCEVNGNVVIYCELMLKYDNYDEDP
jgi:hypothetical protein